MEKNQSREGKKKYQKVKQKYNAIQRELDDIRKDNYSGVAETKMI